MKTQKRTSSPKKTKKVVGEVVGGVLSQAQPPPVTLETQTPLKEVELSEETKDKEYVIKLSIDSSEVKGFLDRIEELEKALDKTQQQVEFQKWIANDRMDALEVLTNNPWYKLLWMRFKGLI